MKKSILILAAAAAVMAASSCSKESYVSDSPKSTIGLNAGISEGVSRAVICAKDGDAYPMGWNASDESVSLIITSPEFCAINSNPEYSVSEDGKSASFTFNVSDDIKSSATEYGFLSPASAFADGEISYSALLSQTPTATSADPATCILISDVVETSGLPVSFGDVTFYPAVGFGKMTVKSTGLSGKVSTVVFKAGGEMAIAGTSDEITVNMADLDIDASEDFDVWFAVSAEEEVLLEQGFTVTVTDNTEAVATRTVTKGTLAFLDGIVSEFSVNMAGSPAPVEYCLDLSNVSFTDSYVLNILNGETPVAQLCKEYILTSAVDASKIVVYPLNASGNADVTKGIDIETGGSVSWTSGSSKDECSFAAGEGAVEKLYFCNGAISLTPAGETFTEATTSPMLFKDGGNKTYSVVKIGKVYWMAKNLAAKKYANGSSIGSKTYWELYNSLKYWGAYRYWNDSSSNSEDILYDGYVADEYNDDEIAPEGWAVTAQADWKRLSSYLSSSKGKKILDEEFGGNNITGLGLTGSGYYTGTSFNFIDGVIYYWTPDYTSMAELDKYAFKLTDGSNTIDASAKLGLGKGAYIRCVKKM